MEVETVTEGSQKKSAVEAAAATDATTVVAATVPRQIQERQGLPRLSSLTANPTGSALLEGTPVCNVAATAVPTTSQTRGGSS